MSGWSRFGLKVRLGQSSVALRILITGGFGFIGGRLADHLVRAGHRVVLGSRNAVSSPAWLPEAEVVQIEWNDVEALERCCDRIDVVIHAAGMNAQDCAVDPVGALAFNGVATARLASAANRAGVKRFIYLSTAHVYANPLVGIITEENCTHNLHPYATSHLAGEQAVLGASKPGQFQGVVLRLSNAFGAPTHKEVNCWTLLVNDLGRQAVRTRNLILQTSGLQQRDFIGMSEVCLAVERLAVSSSESNHGRVLNVGAGVSRSVLSMAQLIQQRCAQVLGFEPILHRAAEGVNEQHPTLTYRSNYLAPICSHSNGSDNTEEIDRLLRFCQASFTPAQTPQHG